MHLCLRGLWLVLLASASIARAGDADPRWTDARIVIARGEGLFEAGNFEAALAEFESAHELLAGHDRQFVVLYNLAVCHERLFRYDEAIRFYEAYLRAAGPQIDDRTVVMNLLTSLRGLLATLTIDANVPAELWVNDRRIGAVPGTFHIPAGRHLIEVRARLHESARLEVQLKARATSHEFVQLEPLSNYRGLSRGYFYGGVALTAAAAVTTAILGGLTLSARDRGLERAAAGMNLRTRALEREEERVRTLALGADIALAGTVLFGATTVLLSFLTDWEREEAVTIRPARASLGLEGSFP